MEATQTFKLEYYKYHEAESIRNWNINQLNQFGIKLSPAQMYAMICSWQESYDGLENSFIKGHVYVSKKHKIVVSDKYNLHPAFKKLAFEGGTPMFNTVNGWPEPMNKATHKNLFYFESFVKSQQIDWQTRPERNFHALSLPTWEFCLDDHHAELAQMAWDKHGRATWATSGVDESQIAYAKLTGSVLTVAFKSNVCLADFLNFPVLALSPTAKHTSLQSTMLLWQPHDLALAHVERPSMPNKPHFALVENKGEVLYTCGSEAETMQLVLSMLDNENLGKTIWHIGRLWVPEKRYVLGSV